MNHEVVISTSRYPLMKSMNLNLRYTSYTRSSLLSNNSNLLLLLHSIILHYIEIYGLGSYIIISEQNLITLKNKHVGRYYTNINA